jgi:UDP-N-acetylglucosamine diphosphorylase / glucose-1-phosphate thymidylyltransferase / UDP-N-acetylgalactosamine diphosphorylase / glucosamine-1-phosphate N-acetyltransferase / galactosamine-1-phosphate N-acetyltransferase
MYNYETKNYLPVGNKCGVIMGDFSRTAINTAINTGTVIGLSCNVFLGGLTPKFIPDFSWGEKGKYDFEKAILDIKNWKKMKGEQLEDQEIEILKYIFESSGQRE